MLLLSLEKFQLGEKVIFRFISTALHFDVSLEISFFFSFSFLLATADNGAELTGKSFFYFNSIFCFSFCCVQKVHCSFKLLFSQTYFVTARTTKTENNQGWNEFCMNFKTEPDQKIPCTVESGWQRPYVRVSTNCTENV